MTNAETNDKAATVGEHGAQVAPEKGVSKKRATRKKGAPKGQKAAKGGKNKATAPRKAAKVGNKAAKEARTRRTETKGTKILEILGRPKGATLGEIMKAVAWQAHSVRGYLSTAAKKQRIKIESAKNNAGERTYRIAK